MIKLLLSPEESYYHMTEEIPLVIEQFILRKEN